MSALPGAGRIRLLLLSDSHLGFDLPARQRVPRPLRGPAFFNRFERALAPAMTGEVDLVVHAGDLFHRSRVRAGVVGLAMDMLARVTARGVPVVIVPGNHERSRLPFPLMALEAGVHVYRRPTTFTFEAAGVPVALAGFPFTRRLTRADFDALLEATGWRHRPAGVRLLCLHQTVEGARVGAHDYLFRAGLDVIPGRAIPTGFAAVLAGHIHRAQVLTVDLGGRPLAAPVVMPGATSRTSVAERFETKGFRLLELVADEAGGTLVSDRFVPLDRPACTRGSAPTRVVAGRPQR